MLSYAKSATRQTRRSAEWIQNGKSQLFNSWGDVKWAYFKKVECSFKGDLTHTVSPNLMLILSTYGVVLHPSYLQKVFSFIIFIKESYRFTILSKKSRAPGGVPCGRS